MIAGGKDKGVPFDSLGFEIKEHVNDWILLFQLTSIEKEDFEFIVGDCGVIYFFIKKEDLKNKDFSNIHCAGQF